MPLFLLLWNADYFPLENASAAFPWGARFVNKSLLSHSVFTFMPIVGVFASCRGRFFSVASVCGAAPVSLRGAGVVCVAGTAAAPAALERFSGAAVSHLSAAFRRATSSSLRPDVRRPLLWRWLLSSTTCTQEDVSVTTPRSAAYITPS